MDKEGVDEISRAEVVFPHHGSQCGGAAQPAGAVGEIHGGQPAARDPKKSLSRALQPAVLDHRRSGVVILQLPQLLIKLTLFCCGFLGQIELDGQQ